MLNLHRPSGDGGGGGGGGDSLGGGASPSDGGGGGGGGGGGLADSDALFPFALDCDELMTQPSQSSTTTETHGGGALSSSCVRGVRGEYGSEVAAGEIVRMSRDFAPLARATRDDDGDDDAGESCANTVEWAMGRIERFRSAVRQ
jgi:hypothetical protein